MLRLYLCACVLSVRSFFLADYTYARGRRRVANDDVSLFSSFVRPPARPLVTDSNLLFFDASNICPICSRCLRERERGRGEAEGEEFQSEGKDGQKKRRSGHRPSLCMSSDLRLVACEKGEERKDRNVIDAYRDGTQDSGRNLSLHIHMQHYALKVQRIRTALSSTVLDYTKAVIESSTMRTLLRSRSLCFHFPVHTCTEIS